MKKALKNLLTSLVYLLEGVILATIGLIAVAVFGGAGIAKWTWERIVDAWADN